MMTKTTHQDKTYYGVLIPVRGCELRYYSVVQAESELIAESMGELLADEIGVHEQDRGLINCSAFGSLQVNESRRQMAIWLQQQESRGAVDVQDWMKQTKVVEC